MTRFKFRAYSSLGDLREGEVDAKNSQEASDDLWSRGLAPFDLEEAGRVALLSPWARWRSPDEGTVKLKDLAAFTREFAILEQAEIPIDDGLRILSKQGASPLMRRLADGLLVRVTDGATLSDAMQKQPTFFSEEYVSAVRAGEAAGAHGQVLSELADMFERRLELQAKLRSALVYPCALLGMAAVSTATVVGFLVPSIAPIFADSGKPMPAGLQFVIQIEGNWVPLSIGGVLFLALAYWLCRAALSRPDLRVRWDRVRLKLPAIGPFTAKRETARFARTLGTLIRAGVPLLQGLESARAVVTNRHLEIGLDNALNSVRDGHSLAQALEGVEGLPGVVLQMISVGEEARKVDRMLLRIATMFEAQTERQVDRAMSLLTPALTVIIADIVGGLILTVMNAILGLNDLAAQ